MRDWRPFCCRWTGLIRSMAKPSRSCQTASLEAEQGIGAGERDDIVFAKARSAPPLSTRSKDSAGTELATKMRELALIA